MTLSLLSLNHADIKKLLGTPRIEPGAVGTGSQCANRCAIPPPPPPPTHHFCLLVSEASKAFLLKKRRFSIPSYLRFPFVVDRENGIWRDFNLRIRFVFMANDRIGFFPLLLLLLCLHSFVHSLNGSVRNTPSPSFLSKPLLLLFHRDHRYSMA